MAKLQTRPEAGPCQPRQEVAIMVRSMPWKFALIAVGAFASLASLAGRSFAEDSEGIVRICDQAPGPANAGGHAAAGCPSCQSGQPCRSHCGSGGRRCGVYGYYGNGQCGYRGYGCMRPTGHVHQFLDWFNPHGMCTHSPDHGYAPPGKIRTPHPQQVAYTKGFPDAWTGQPGAGGVGGPRPVSIYMPTDTTQLGYYYQATPRWHANRAMQPPVPVPSQWHRDLCQSRGCQQCRGQGHGNCPHCRGNAAGAQTVPGEQIINEGMIDAQPHYAQPNEAQPLEAQPNVAPVTEEPAPIPIPVEPASAAPEVPAPVNPAPNAAPLEKAENPVLQQIN